MLHSIMGEMSEIIFPLVLPAALLGSAFTERGMAGQPDGWYDVGAIRIQ
jgi:hypothetical protein